jgi:hypothetical protein
VSNNKSEERQEDTSQKQSAVWRFELNAS